MASATSIRCFDYVNHSYDKVCEALSQHTNEVFHNATRSADQRPQTNSTIVTARMMKVVIIPKSMRTTEIEIYRVAEQCPGSACWAQLATALHAPAAS